MSDSYLVPKLFTDLINQVGLEQELTPEVEQAYFAAIGSDESLLPELACILGPQPFFGLITHLGGQTLKVPRVSDVIRLAKKEIARGTDNG